jgi:hypothetical protein
LFFARGEIRRELVPEHAEVGSQHLVEGLKERSEDDFADGGGLVAWQRMVGYAAHIFIRP